MDVDAFLSERREQLAEVASRLSTLNADALAEDVSVGQILSQVQAKCMASLNSLQRTMAMLRRAHGPDGVLPVVFSTALVNVKVLLRDVEGARGELAGLNMQDGAGSAPIAESLDAIAAAMHDGFSDIFAYIIEYKTAYDGLPERHSVVISVILFIAIVSLVIYKSMPDILLRQ